MLMVLLNILSGMMIMLPHYCRSSYGSGSVQVTKIAGCLRVTVGSSTMECDLHELTTSDRCSKLQLVYWTDDPHLSNKCYR